MKEQKEYYKEIVNLIEENPDLEVFTMTYYEVCADDSGYWKGKIENVEVNLYYEDGNGRMYFGEDQITDELECQFGPDEDIDKIYEENIANGEIKKAIVIRINL